MSKGVLRVPGEEPRVIEVAGDTLSKQVAALREASNTAVTEAIEKIEREQGVVQRDLNEEDMEVERDEQEEDSESKRRKKKEK